MLRDNNPRCHTLAILKAFSFLNLTKNSATVAFSLEIRSHYISRSLNFTSTFSWYFRIDFFMRFVVIILFNILAVRCRFDINFFFK